MVPELTAHNIFLADEYQSSFDSIFKEHLIPDEPSFYVNVPSRVDPTAAPEGRDSIVVLVPVGHLLSNDSGTHKGTPNSSGQSQDWPKLRALAREKILTIIKLRTGVDLGPLIIHEQVNDPLTWRDNFNLDRGGILGLSHSFFNVLSFRPKTKHADIDGLYFVGASTHPGTGVPVCLAGGKIVASQVLQDHKLDVPWSECGIVPAAARKEEQGLDAIHKPISNIGLLVTSVALLVSILALLLQWTNPAAFNGMSDWTVESIMPHGKLMT
jgi:phytoene desaturase (3,4-didehydrolycopene-forming)